jgi:hypothetical protein
MGRGGWGTDGFSAIPSDTVRRFLVAFEVDRGNGDVRRGRAEVEWTGPISSMDDIVTMEALIGEGEGGSVAITGWQQFED